MRWFDLTFWFSWGACWQQAICRDAQHKLKPHSGVNCVMWANTLSEHMEVNVIDNWGDISPELTAAWGSGRATTLHDQSNPHTCNHENEERMAMSSVGNGSGPSLQVWVRVVQSLFPNQWSGLSSHPNCHFGYGLKDISHPLWIGWIASRLSSRYVGRFV